MANYTIQNCIHLRIPYTMIIFVFSGFCGSEIPQNRVSILGFSNPTYNIGDNKPLNKVNKLTREARINSQRKLATINSFKPKQTIPVGLRDSSRYQLEEDTFYDAQDESSLPFRQQFQNELQQKLGNSEATYV